MRLNVDEKYQPLGTAVLTANGLLLVEYTEGRSKLIQGNEYKDLLKKNYKPLYDSLLPYLVKIDNNIYDNNFVVSVFDDQILILTDWSCTERRIDCWSYNGDCSPETLQVKCDK
jgi:hypothetical protein